MNIFLLLSNIFSILWSNLNGLFWTVHFWVMREDFMIESCFSLTLILCYRHFMPFRSSWKICWHDMRREAVCLIFAVRGSWKTIDWSNFLQWTWTPWSMRILLFVRLFNTGDLIQAVSFWVCNSQDWLHWSSCCCLEWRDDLKDFTTFI